MLSALEIHTLEQSYLSFSERISCNYKGHSDHTLRALFHMRHNWFISGVIHANYEWCTSACRATSNFPAVQVQVKGAYTIIGKSSAKQKHAEHRRKDIKKRLEYTPLSPERKVLAKRINQSMKKATMSCMSLRARPCLFFMTVTFLSPRLSFIGYNWVDFLCNLDEMLLSKCK